MISAVPEHQLHTVVIARNRSTDGVCGTIAANYQGFAILVISLAQQQYLSPNFPIMAVVLAQLAFVDVANG